MNKMIILCLVAIGSNMHSSYKEQIMKQYYKNASVLITGGCGFIGSHLAHALVAYGAQVTILDDLSTGSVENIHNIRNKVTFIQGSITNPDLCLKAAQGKTHIFHLAAFISVAQSVKEPALCHAINIDGTFNMLNAARLSGCKRFVFSSSAAVYGTPETTCTETMPCNPLSPYGFSKYIGEQLCNQFLVTYELETVCLRYFNVYGPKQNPQGEYAAVVAKFNDNIEKNEPITIFGDGLQTRDFIPVAKVVEANLLVGMMPAEQVAGSVYNVATGKSITLLELFEQLKEDYPDYQQLPKFLPARDGDIKRSYADCGRLKELYSYFADQ